MGDDGKTGRREEMWEMMVGKGGDVGNENYGR